MAKRWTILLLAFALLGLPAPAQTPDPGAERLLFALTNQIRAEHHLLSLSWDPALAVAARIHAARIIRIPSALEHQYPGELDLITRAAQAGAHFSTISENLARGRTSPAAIEQLWMSTAIHRANLLDPHLDAVGIGVLEQDGVLYAVQDFAHTSPGLSQDGLEAQIIALLRSQGLTSVVSSAAARSACQQHATSAEDARLIVQWEGDTQHLPNVLLDQLRQVIYRAAAVGACGSSGQGTTGFTSGRVAVLLF